MLTEFAEVTLRDRYLQSGDTCPQDAFRRAADAFSDSPAMAERMYKYISEQWLSLATPVLSNAPVRQKRTTDGSLDNFDSSMFSAKRVGLPISCFLNYVDDSRAGLGEHYNENIWLASGGGGIGGYWGALRSDGAKTSNGSVSTGSIPFLHVVDSQMLAFQQGKVRRGSYAAYIDISHPEVIEFLEMRKPTGGDVNRKCLNLHHGVNITDDFMLRVNECLDGDDSRDAWDLIDPNSLEVVSTVSVMDLWERILHLRATTGEPYIHFIDTTNRLLPQSQQDLGLKVHQSNLCSEITLPTSTDRTAVCCLSSLNLEHWHKWKDAEGFIKDCVRFLDNVLEYFIRNAENMPKAVYSATRERSIGLGALGYHSLLQSLSIPFESAMHVGLNRKIFQHIKEEALEATIELGTERGEAPDSLGSGRRNSHLLSIAPNASSSIILNTSPSVEPIKANIFTHKTLSGSFVVKNKHLDDLIYDRIMEKGGDIGKIWKSILANNGSVQHLDILTDWEKDVFKTADEIDQRWIIDTAGDRQKFICQSQSINLFIPHGFNVKDFSELHTRAWFKGLKTLYYCRSAPAQRAENLSNSVERLYLDEGECLSCEG